MMDAFVNKTWDYRGIFISHETTDLFTNKLEEIDYVIDSISDNKLFLKNTKIPDHIVFYLHGYNRIESKKFGTFYRLDGIDDLVKFILESGYKPTLLPLKNNVLAYAAKYFNSDSGREKNRF